MIGAIAGDIIGSIYEVHNINTVDFPLFDPRCRFTDDTVLTVAIADAILTGSSYADKLKEYFRYYPNAGYGPSFRRWAVFNSMTPYYGQGSGSAMRVSPVGFAFDSLEEVLKEAKKSAEVTHNHPEGIRGAQATAAAIFLARTGKSKREIKGFFERVFGYDFQEPVDGVWNTCPGMFVKGIRKYYRIVPQALTAFFESNDFEDAIRKAISIGGDSDTMACITGGVAEAYYGEIPDHIKTKVFQILDERLKRVIQEFNLFLTASQKERR